MARIAALVQDLILASRVRTSLEASGHAAPGWLRDNALPARLVANNGEVTRLGGWPEPDESVASPAPSSDRKVLGATLGA